MQVVLPSGDQLVIPEWMLDEERCRAAVRVGHSVICISRGLKEPYQHRAVWQAVGRVHHVHADDVAQYFVRAVERRRIALGESFHVVSPAPLILREYAERVSGWFGHSAQLPFLPWQEWRQGASEETQP